MCKVTIVFLYLAIILILFFFYGIIKRTISHYALRGNARDGLTLPRESITLSTQFKKGGTST